MLNTTHAAGAFLIAKLMLAGPAAAALQHTVLAPANCPICTDAQKAAWTATHDSTFRVRAKDLLGHRIGLNRAERYSGSPKYLPILHEKQIGCGRFKSFGLYINDHGEWDWNIKVEPTAYSRAMHDAIRNATPATKLQEWPCDGDCFKGEITTDNGFRDNPYFNADVPVVTMNVLGFDIPIGYDTSKASSILTTSDTLCMYGPWVQDRGHSDHAEIHPSEIVWWRDRATGAVYAIILQDDSNRFDRPENFRMDDPPNWSRPWSAFPRWTELRVAFAAEASGAAPGFLTIDDIEVHRILTEYNTAASHDSDDGSTHALEYNGNIIMEVRELESPSDRVGVTFVDMCRLATDEGELIIGYVALQTVIGDHDRGDGGDARDEGYYVLKLTFDEPIRFPPIADFRGLIGRLRPFRTSRAAVDSAARVVAIPDRPAREPRAPRYTLSAPALRPSGGALVGEFNGRRTGPGTTPVTVRGSVRLNARPGARIPIIHGGVVTIRDAGDAIRIQLPDHRLDALVRRDTVIAVARDDAAAPVVAAFVGRNLNPRTITGRVMRVRTRRLEIQPEYIARGDTVDHLGDESPIGEILNGAIEAAAAGDRAQLLRLYGTGQPFVISWTFSARDLNTGNVVRVASGPPARGIPAVQVSSGAFTNSRVTIHMPASGVYELTATARMRDANGIEGTHSYTVHSHEVAAGTAEELLEVLGVSRTSAVSEAAPPIGSRAAYRAVARSLAGHATADGTVTLREMAGLAAAIDAWQR